MIDWFIRIPRRSEGGRWYSYSTLQQNQKICMYFTCPQPWKRSITILKSERKAGVHWCECLSLWWTKPLLIPHTLCTIPYIATEESSKDTRRETVDLQLWRAQGSTYAVMLQMIVLLGEDPFFGVDRDVRWWWTTWTSSSRCDRRHLALCWTSSLDLQKWAQRFFTLLRSMVCTVRYHTYYDTLARITVASCHGRLLLCNWPLP